MTQSPLTPAEIDFPLFTVIWNRAMEQPTPALHLKMARWLEAGWHAKKTRLLLMAFRSAGKSTIAGLFAAWLLYRNPDLRILVLAADLTLAKKMVRNVKRIIERHPLTPHLKPEKLDQWAGERFTVNRRLELRDPSMLARGIGANITGSRADIVICDDVEVPGTSDSADKRAALRERLAEMRYVLMSGGTQLYIGTPHSYYTIYAKEARREIGEESPFLKGFRRLEIPILDKKGKSAWSGRYSEEDVAQMRLADGPNKFASQMMLRPVNITEGRLNPDLLRVYNDELSYSSELRTLFLGKTKLVSADAFWDPAFGSAKGDDSVLAVVFADGQGRYYLHHLEYIRIEAERAGIQARDCGPRTVSRENTDEATAQCRIVAQIAKKLYLPCVTVETNGIGKFLPRILRGELAKQGVPCGVMEIHQSVNKDLRILESFDALLAARRLSISRNILDTTPFMMEMREWKPGASSGRDDALDAVAGTLARQPDRLKVPPRLGAYRWMPGSGTHKAQDDFDV